MPTDALVTMVVAMILLWGGLAASIAYAVKVSRAERRGGSGSRPPEG